MIKLTKILYKNILHHVSASVSLIRKGTLLPVHKFRALVMPHMEASMVHRISVKIGSVLV